MIRWIKPTVTIEKKTDRAGSGEDSRRRETFPVQTGRLVRAAPRAWKSILSHTEGVTHASVNFASGLVLVEYDNKALSSGLTYKTRCARWADDLIVGAEDPQEAQQQLEQQHYREVKRRTLGAALLTCRCSCWACS